MIPTRKLQYVPPLRYLDTVSSVVVPLADGLIRRRMLNRGVRQRELRLGGVVVNYYERLRWGVPRLADLRSGRNAPIVLVHGIGDSALTWGLVIRALARNHDVYALDLYGHGLTGLPSGQSYATLAEHTALLHDFIARVVGRPALVVGNSLGGLLAVRLAQEAPALLTGIALLNPGGAPLDGRASYDPFFAKISDPSLRTTSRVVNELVGVVPGPTLLLGLRSFQRMFQRKVIQEAYAAADDSAFLGPDEIARLPVPAALVWGLRDHFLPAGSFAFFHTALANAPQLLLERCGHLPQRERPVAVRRFLARFADQIAQKTQVTT